MALGWRRSRSQAQGNAAPESRAADNLAADRNMFTQSATENAVSPALGSAAPEGGSLKGYSTLCRMARFGANLSDAHSCFVFFPSTVVGALEPGLVPPQSSPDGLVLSGYHSLSPEVIPHCEVPRASGLIGWVASHSRAIHVSPFELDSRTLGIYATDQQLKSFIGLPVVLQDPYDMLGSAGIPPEHLTGVLACDSKKSFAFSKLQGKLLEDLSREIAASVALLIEQQGRAHPDVAWHSFLRRATELSRSISIGSLEIVRIVPNNFGLLERTCGTSAALIACEQIFRIVRQILPPHFPAVRLINGDIVMAFDNMMTSFYESRIRAVSSHHQGRHPARSSAAAEGLQFEFIKASGRDRKRKDCTIEELVQLTSVDQAGSTASSAARSTMTGTDASRAGSVVRLEREVNYGNRRA